MPGAHSMTAILYFLIGLAPAVIAARAVRSGKLTMWYGSIFRRESPIGFWGIVIFYLALMAFFWVEVYLKLSPRR